MYQEMGKYIIIFGIILIILGMLLWFSPKIPLLGKLPGDIFIKNDNFTFYAPITTSILISLILTVLINILIRVKK